MCLIMWLGFIWSWCFVLVLEFDIRCYIVYYYYIIILYYILLYIYYYILYYTILYSSILIPSSSPLPISSSQYPPSHLFSYSSFLSFSSFPLPNLLLSFLLIHSILVGTYIYLFIFNPNPSRIGVLSLGWLFGF